MSFREFGHLGHGRWVLFPLRKRAGLTNFATSVVAQTLLSAAPRLRLELDIGSAYNIVVKRRAATTTPRNGASHGATVSPLGRDLSRIAERIASSGIKPLSRKEVAREVSERRGGR
jgi:hypothetical protein